ncbi:MAG: DnaJ domain-containing protein [Treponema sp.]|nr:DnaJ domain-containing protein [Treponema sp.]
MERYYQILGIPNNSSKEEIKKAYYEKINVLHPDKIHGTPLEATATFFTAEINDAYNALMSEYKKNNKSLNHEKQKDFIKDDIFIEGFGVLKYIISNDINLILNAVTIELGTTISHKTNEIPWVLNTELSENVKSSMRKHNMNYSMTINYSGSYVQIILNKRKGNYWYIVHYEDTPIEEDNIEKHYKNKSEKTSKSEFNVIFWKMIKISIAIIAIIFIYNIFYNSLTSDNRLSSQANRSKQVFAAVSCDWLNVRSTPAKINDYNIIEAIRYNTKVEILENAGDGWVRVKYNNGKTGYVYEYYLSRQ